MFNVFSRLSKLVRNLRTIVSDCLSFFANIGRRRLALAAENLFLRKQLALFREREKKAMPSTPADRFVFSKLARWFDWRSALVIVKPATLIGWHRAAFRRFWRWKSRAALPYGLLKLAGGSTGQHAGRAASHRHVGSRSRLRLVRAFRSRRESPSFRRRTDPTRNLPEGQSSFCIADMHHATPRDRQPRPERAARSGSLSTALPAESRPHNRFH
jgi:hypothetical protein